MFWRRKPATTGVGLEDRLRSGDLAAVGEAYELHHVAVRTFARRLVGDDAAAEDLTQDVFVMLPRIAGKFDGRSSLRTFLIGLAINHARHHVRSAMRRRNAWQKGAQGREDAGQSPDRSATDRDLARQLTQALDKLPLDQRGVFVLCEVEERSASEVAAIVGIPEATVRTRLFHARRKLRELFASEDLR